MGIDCRLDLGSGSEAAGSDKRVWCGGVSRCLGWAVVVSGDEIGDWKNLRNDPHGNTASIAWPGQACPESFALYL